MERKTWIDEVIHCKRFSTALRKFTEKYQVEEDWVETFRWMYETGSDSFSDEIMGDGTRNESWRYALHLYVEPDCYIFSLTERE